MFQGIQAAFKEILTESEWMDAESREAALQKAEKMFLMLAYPDFVEDKTTLDKFYENVRICQWDHYGNSQRIRAYKQAYKFSLLQDPMRRDL